MGLVESGIRVGAMVMDNARVDGVFRHREVSTGNGTFLDAVSAGLDAVQIDSARASDALAAFAINPEIATHEVMLAMEQARVSLQLAVEVRQRLVDAGKEITGMQI